MPSANVIEVRSLSKRFKELTAVDGITLDIKEGEIFGLLGPNGAGKTTTISMLSTILKPTGGSATVRGHDIAKEKDAVRKSIGIVFQDPSLDDELTTEENLDFHGRLYGMESGMRKKRITEMLELVELDDRRAAIVKTFSGGMKRRLEIARGLLHLPHVLFLDEPTIGLDPQTRRNLWGYIKKFNREQKVSIILTTHYMEEADFLCDRIAIIDHGKIIALGTPEGLKDVLGGDVVSVCASETDKLKTLLEKADFAKDVKKFDGNLNIVTDNGSTSIPKIIRLAEENGVRIDCVTLKRPSLEDVFIHYTGRAIREEEGDNGKDALRRRRGWRAH